MACWAHARHAARRLLTSRASTPSAALVYARASTGTASTAGPLASPALHTSPPRALVVHHSRDRADAPATAAGESHTARRASAATAKAWVQAVTRMCRSAMPDASWAAGGPATRKSMKTASASGAGTPAAGLSLVPVALPAAAPCLGELARRRRSTSRGCAGDTGSSVTEAAPAPPDATACMRSNSLARCTTGVSSSFDDARAAPPSWCRAENSRVRSCRATATAVRYTTLSVSAGTTGCAAASLSTVALVARASQKACMGGTAVNTWSPAAATQRMTRRRERFFSTGPREPVTPLTSCASAAARASSDPCTTRCRNGREVSSDPSGSRGTVASLLAVARKGNAVVDRAAHGAQATADVRPQAKKDDTTQGGTHQTSRPWRRVASRCPRGRR